MSVPPSTIARTAATLAALCLVISAEVSAATAANPDELAFYGRGTFALCTFAQSDEAKADYDRRMWDEERARALARARGAPNALANGEDLSRLDLNAELRKALLMAVVTAVLPPVLDARDAERAQAAQAREAFLRREGAALESIAQAIEQEIIGRRGGRSAGLEARIRDLATTQLLPRLKRLEAQFTPSVSRILLRGLAPGKLVDIAVDVLRDFSFDAMKLILAMDVADDRARRIAAVEMSFAPRLMVLTSAKYEAQRIIEMACVRRAEVDARRDRTPSGTIVGEGECLRIAPDLGSRITWARHRGADITAGPEGTDIASLGPPTSLGAWGTALRLSARPLLSAPPGALLLAVAMDDGEGALTEPVAIGRGGFFRMPAAGELVFQVNDAHLGNNRGAFVVEFSKLPLEDCPS
jgi:hypothetical protein